MATSERHAYVLMDIIQAPVVQATLLSTTDKPATVEATTELGFYGVYVGSATEVVLNSCPGHLLRTKAATSREIGIAVGLGNVDSPLLI